MEEGDRQLAALASLNEPQRRRLYRHVAAQDAPVSRDDAAAALEIPRSVAAFHLEKLVELGLLDVESRRPAGRSGPGAGRPAKLYHRATTEISLSVPERQYGLMARLLAEAVDRSMAASVPVAEALRVVAREYGTELGAPLSSTTSTPRARKVEAMIGVLADHGYEPRAVGRTVVLRNCPFHALAQEHRELICSMNLELLRGVAEAAGLPSDVAQMDPAPARCCVSLRP